MVSVTSWIPVHSRLGPGMSCADRQPQAVSTSIRLRSLGLEVPGPAAQGTCVPVAWGGIEATRLGHASLARAQPVNRSPK